MHCRDALLLIPILVTVKLGLARLSVQKDNNNHRYLLLVNILILTLQWIGLRSNWNLPNTFNTLGILMFSVQATRFLHGSDPYWVLLIPFYYSIVYSLQTKNHSMIVFLQIIMPRMHLSNSQVIASALLFTLDDFLLWKAGKLQTAVNEIAVWCTEGNLFIGIGDILIPSDLIVALGQRQSGVLGLGLGCILLRQYITNQPLPALVFLVPPIIASCLVAKLYGHLRLLTLRNVDKNVCACLMKASRSSADFLRALFNMKKRRPLPVNRSSCVNKKL